MNTSEEYCIACGQDGPLRREQKATEFDVRGETLRITVPMKVCPACGTTELEDVDPAEIAFAEYRRRKGLLSPGQIRETRERYQLSQKSFAALLGMSEATINRYEGGGIQDEAHDQAIRACGNPDVVADLLKRRSHKLSDWQRLRVEAALGHTGEPRQWGGERMFDRIEINPRVCNGNPVIRGTRIPVAVVLDHLAAGEAWESILEGFPELAREDISAALVFAREFIEHTEIVAAATA